ncbi:MAG: hypothetical protein ACTHKP_12835, partial [Nitrososphaeraceae archaeon]
TTSLISSFYYGSQTGFRGHLASATNNTVVNGATIISIMADQNIVYALHHIPRVCTCCKGHTYLIGSLYRFRP